MTDLQAKLAMEKLYGGEKKSYEPDPKPVKQPKKGPKKT